MLFSYSVFDFFFCCFADCTAKFSRVGCYRDSLIDPRPLPELLMTDRDVTSHAYSGKKIDWKNWNEYLPDLVCRCAKKTRDKGYNVFGLQFYGKYKSALIYKNIARICYSAIVL